MFDKVSKSGLPYNVKFEATPATRRVRVVVYDFRADLVGSADRGSTEPRDRDSESRPGPGASLAGRSAGRERVLAVPRFPDSYVGLALIALARPHALRAGKSRQPLVAFRTRA